MAHSVQSWRNFLLFWITITIAKALNQPRKSIWEVASKSVSLSPNRPANIETFKDAISQGLLI
jgi:hypothetical protein